MKRQTLLCVLLFGLAVAIATDPTSLPEWLSFQAWAAQHNKQYPTLEETFQRFNVWKENLDYINTHNAGKSGFFLRMNQFGDLTADEYTAKVSSSTSIPRRPRPEIALDLDPTMLPAEVNWLAEGIVTPVKDQGTSCAAGWAFAAAGVLESAQARATAVRPAISLSAQNLIDCSYKYGNDGCHGGRLDYALDYVIDNAGLDDETSYPYTTAATGYCRFTRSAVSGTLSRYHELVAGNPLELMMAVANIGPVAATLDASRRTFQFYGGGVYRDNECVPAESDRHAVVIVGYGTDDATGEAYWLVKNSFGTEWGIDGYMKVSRLVDCGVSTYAVYAIPGGANAYFANRETTEGIILSSGPSGTAGSQTSSTGSQTSSTGSETSSTGSETSSTGSETSSTGSQTSSTGSETSSTGSQTSSTGSQTSATGSQTSSTGSETSSTGSQTSLTGSETSSTGSQTSLTGSETSSTGSETSGLETSGSETSGRETSGRETSGSQSSIGASEGSSGLFLFKKF